MDCVHITLQFVSVQLLKQGPDSHLSENGSIIAVDQLLLMAAMFMYALGLQELTRPNEKVNSKQFQIDFVRFLKVRTLWLTAPKRKSPSERIVCMLIPSIPIIHTKTHS